MNCRSHNDRAGVASIYDRNGELAYLCKECSLALPSPGGRAYGTGVGPAAHAEAQEAGGYDRQWQEGKLNAKVRKYL